MSSRYGFKPSFNPTYEVPDSPTGWWVTPYHFGIDQGPVDPDDRELPHRADLEHHAPLALRDDRPPQSRLHAGSVEPAGTQR